MLFGVDRTQGRSSDSSSGSGSGSSSSSEMTTNARSSAGNNSNRLQYNQTTMGERAQIARKGEPANE